MDKPATIAAAVGITVALLVFFVTRTVAFETICDCWSSRIAGTVASACLGMFLGMGVGNRVLGHMRRPQSA